jgi:hypothetical protein
VAGSVTPNTIAQGKNRTTALLPLLTSKERPFEIYRSCQSRDWPGDAAVHISTIHLRRAGQPDLLAPTRRIVQVVEGGSEGEGVEQEEEAPIAESTGELRLIVVPLEGAVDCSFLDGGVETELKELPGQKTLAYQGMIARGPFDRPVEFLHQVPAGERHAVYAYLNNRDVQQQPEPLAQRVIIDVYDALVQAGLDDAEPPAQEAWLRENLPFLFGELESTVIPERRNLPQSDRNKSARAYPWLFEECRPGLRSACFSYSTVIAIGAVSKVFKPVQLNVSDEGLHLQVRPTHNLFFVPSESVATFGLLSCTLIEILIRRLCATLETRLSFSPTTIFPYFPFPWTGQPTGNPAIAPILNPPAAVEARLAPAAQALLDLRRSLLTTPDQHGLARGELRGPTALYNAFDNPRDARPAIEALREAHRRLEAAVLAEYGWDDLADPNRWTFDRPWIDGTDRYVPNLATRREYLRRLAALNHTQAHRS